METIFDAKITEKEFESLFKEAEFTYDNYLSFPNNRLNKKYHLAQLMFLRGNKTEGMKYLKDSGVPIGMQVDWCD